MTETLKPAALKTLSPRLALAVITIAILMTQVDATIVNVALPSIQHSLGFSGSGLAWVVTAFSLTHGGLVLLGGRAGDILGHRQVFLVGTLVFTVASAAGGFATEQWWLIVCRGLQGVGCAAAVPAALALIVAIFPEGAPRNRAIGLYSAVVTAGGAVGLLAGGLISTYLPWYWVMFVNVPVGVLVLAAGPRVLPKTEGIGGRFDLPGALTGTLGVTLVVYGLIAGAVDHSGTSHWGDPVVVSALVSGVVMLVAFGLIEKRSPHALVPLRIFTDRTRSGILTVSVLTTTATFGLYFFLTIFMQEVWRYSPFRTALVYLPLTVAVVVGIRLSSRLQAKVGAPVLLVCGLAATAAGMIWLSWIGDSAGYLTGMLVPSVLAYVGLGIASLPTTTTALRGVDPGETGVVSGVLGAARRVGGATGLAVLGTVTWAAAASAQATAPTAQNALATGVSYGIAVAGGLMVLALLVALLTVRRKAGHTNESGKEE